MRKRIAVYIEVADYAIIKAYSEAKHRSVSNYLVSSAMSEINRHTSKTDVKAIVVTLLEEMGIHAFPSRGEASRGGSEWDLR